VNRRYASLRAHRSDVRGPDRLHLEVDDLPGLRAARKPAEQTAVLESERIQRGPMSRRTARCWRAAFRSEGTFTRVYPTGELFATVGTTTRSRQQRLEPTGEQLTGRTGRTAVDTQQLQGKDPSGKVVTTLDPRAARRERRAGGIPGFVTASNAHRGVTVMASSPGFDPTCSLARRIRKADGTRARDADHRAPHSYARDDLQGGHGDRRDRQRRVHPESTISGRNSGDLRYPALEHNNEEFGQITLKQRSRSRSTRLGAGRRETRQADDGPLHGPFASTASAAGLPAEEMSANGEYEGDGHQPLSPLVDVGRWASAGQLEATRCRCEVAAAVANRGTLMVPHMRPRGRSGRRTVETIARACSQSS